MINIYQVVKNRSKILHNRKELNLFPNSVKSIVENFKNIGIPIKLIIADFNSDDWPLKDWLGDVIDNSIEYEVINFDRTFFDKSVALNYSRGLFENDSMILYIDADMIIGKDLVDRIKYRYHAATKGEMGVFAPMFMDENPENPPRKMLESVGSLWIWSEDLKKLPEWPDMLSWGGEDTAFLYNCLKYNMIVHRETDVGPTHQWHPIGLRDKYYENKFDPKNNRYQSYCDAVRTYYYNGYLPNVEKTKVAAIMCTWNRLSQLPKTLECLNLQSDKDFCFYLVNNNIDKKDEIDKIIKEADIRFEINVTHNESNLFCFARFLKGREVMEDHEVTLLLDDDVEFGRDLISRTKALYRPKTLSSWWGHKLLTKGSYWHRYRESEGEEISYGGGCGMILDSSVFENSFIFDEFPEEYYFSDDLWISYCVSHRLKWPMYANELPIYFVSSLASDENSLFNREGVKEKKNMFLNYLGSLGWDYVQKETVKIKVQGSRGSSNNTFFPFVNYSLKSMFQQMEEKYRVKIEYNSNPSIIEQYGEAHHAVMKIDGYKPIIIDMRDTGYILPQVDAQDAWFILKMAFRADEDFYSRCGIGVDGDEKSKNLGCPKNKLIPWITLHHNADSMPYESEWISNFDKPIELIFTGTDRVNRDKGWKRSDICKTIEKYLPDNCYIGLHKVPFEKADVLNERYESHIMTALYEEYKDKLKESRVGLSLPGLGLACYRELEYFANCIPCVMPKFGIQYNEPIKENFHYVSFDIDNPESFRFALRSLKNKDFYNFISKNAWEWWTKNCKIENICNSFVSACSKDEKFKNLFNRLEKKDG